MLAIEFALAVSHFLHGLMLDSRLTYAKDTHTFVQHSTARIENKLGGIHHDIQVCGLPECFVDCLLTNYWLQEIKMRQDVYGMYQYQRCVSRPDVTSKGGPYCHMPSLRGMTVTTN